MDEKNPKVFVSYSWASPEYGDRVLALAEQLTADGVHVLLDRWDLREGQDKHQFMEKAVADESVRRVLVLIDPTYAEKADGRMGGVGTETLIISAEVYKEARQEKFVPVIMERDQDGTVVVPTYMAGRIYIDLSDNEHSQPEYEKLLRNIYGKPELVRPPVGTAPAYIDQSKLALTTGRSVATFRDAVLRSRPHQAGLLGDYLARLAEAIAQTIVVDADSAEALEERLSTHIENLLPYRAEFLDLLDFVAKDESAAAFFERIHAFFEQLTNIRYRHEPRKWNDEAETEAISFFAWELYLYAVAAALRNGAFPAVDALTQPLLVSSRRFGAGVLRTFDVIVGPCRVLQEQTQKRLGTRYYFYPAQLLRQRAEGAQPPWDALVEADVVLWFKAETTKDQTWYPRTAFYWENVHSLPLFARAQSAAFFRKLAPALGVTDVESMRAAFAALPDASFHKAGDFWGGRRAYAELLQLDQLASRP